MMRRAREAAAGLAFAVLSFPAVAQAASPLPADVAAFVGRRESCDHWRGEEGYDAERRAEIQRALCRDCPGTDAQLARLKHKYRSDPTVGAKLDEFEATIEPHDKGEARRGCLAVGKPRHK